MQDARVVAGEENRRVGVDSDTGQVELMGSAENGIEITDTEVRLFCLGC